MTKFIYDKHRCDDGTYDIAADCPCCGHSEYVLTNIPAEEVDLYLSKCRAQESTEDTTG